MTWLGSETTGLFHVCDFSNLVANWLPIEIGLLTLTIFPQEIGREGSWRMEVVEELEKLLADVPGEFRCWSAAHGQLRPTWFERYLNLR